MRFHTTVGATYLLSTAFHAINRSCGFLFFFFAPEETTALNLQHSAKEPLPVLLSTFLQNSLKAFSSPPPRFSGH